MSAFIEAASPHTMNTYGRLPIALSHGQGSEFGTSMASLIWTRWQASP